MYLTFLIYGRIIFVKTLWVQTNSHFNIHWLTLTSLIGKVNKTDFELSPLCLLHILLHRSVLSCSVHINIDSEYVMYKKLTSSLVCMFPGYHSLWRVLWGSTAVEAVSPHVLLGADVVLHIQEALEDGLLLRWPALQGELLVQGGPP